MSRLGQPEPPPLLDPATLEHWRAVDAAVVARECAAKADAMTKAGMFASARAMTRRQGHYEAVVLDVARKLCGRTKR